MANLKMHFLNNKLIIISFVMSVMFFWSSVIVGYMVKINFNKIDYYPNFKEIFLQNTFISIIFIFGILSLGLINLVLLFINGFYFGAALHYSFDKVGILYTLKILIPHSIFEIPSILLSSSIGFILIIFIINKSHNDDKIGFKFYLKYIFLCIPIILLLNFLAASIEVMISMPI